MNFLAHAVFMCCFSKSELQVVGIKRTLSPELRWSFTLTFYRYIPICPAFIRWRVLSTYDASRTLRTVVMPHWTKFGPIYIVENIVFSLLIIITCLPYNPNVVLLDCVVLLDWGKFMSIPWVYFWVGVISLPSFSKLLLLVTLHQNFPFYLKAWQGYGNFLYECGIRYKEGINDCDQDTWFLVPGPPTN